MKNLLGIVLIAVILGATVVSAVTLITQPQSILEITTLKTFSSYEQLSAFVSNGTTGYYNNYGYYYGSMVLDAASNNVRSELLPSAATFAVTYSPEYSTTNVQVAGIDEADIVKTDGNFLYVVSNGQICILNAYPMNILSNFSCGLNNPQLFVDGNRLVVIGNNYTMFYQPPVVNETKPTIVNGTTITIVNETNPGGIDIVPFIYFPTASIKVYDITDRASPTLIRDIGINGSIVASRMYNGYVYVVSSQPSVLWDKVILPFILYNNQTETVPAQDIKYADVPGPYNFVTIIALNLRNDAQIPTYEGFLADSVSTVYMSENNMYLAVPVYPWRVIALTTFAPSVNTPTETGREKTLLYRVSLNGLDMNVEAQGQVWGTINNQFSMDEYGSTFRVTTTEWGSNGTTNNLYVLDKGLNMIGSIENIAPGERIYSTRFVGDRCYLVTFRQVDPFYVIDLSVLSEPRILGYLKTPGYSSYLHPYDESHIIGIGMENNSLKIALFDVTDVTNVTIVAKYMVNGSWSSSEALYEHKAFLFDKSKDLLVLPVYSTYFDNGVWMSWGGAFVFNLTLNGIDLKGTISHGSNNDIQRSLYIDNALYTVSANKVMANDLATLEPINEVELP
jgi:uncharacterized secreted protein with C-terminal beta-propeller domain